MRFSYLLVVGVVVCAYFKQVPEYQKPTNYAPVDIRNSPAEISIHERQSPQQYAAGLNGLNRGQIDFADSTHPRALDTLTRVYYYREGIYVVCSPLAKAMNREPRIAGTEAMISQAPGYVGHVLVHPTERGLYDRVIVSRAGSIPHFTHAERRYIKSLGGWFGTPPKEQ